MTARMSEKDANTATIADVTTADVVTRDLTAATAIDNAQVYIEYLLLGVDTTTLAAVRFKRGCSFSIISGIVTQLDVTPIVLGADLVAVALNGVTPVLDFSGTTIRGRATTILGKTVRFTGYIWLAITDI